jgi:hypothetical protein
MGGRCKWRRLRSVSSSCGGFVVPSLRLAPHRAETDQLTRRVYDCLGVVESWFARGLSSQDKMTEDTRHMEQSTTATKFAFTIHTATAISQTAP